MSKHKAKADRLSAHAVIRSDDSMTEAVRVVIARQYAVMRANEAGCRQGKDDNAIHDMRVAIRRVRVALQLFGGYYRRSAVRPLEQELRQAGRALGAVRDLDVMGAQARRYADVAIKAQRPDLAPLLDDWQAQRQKAHKRLVDYLDGSRFQRLLDDLQAFSTTTGEGTGEKQRTPRQVRHALGSLIWTRYEAVWGYDGRLADAPPAVWHALRIECKYLRYVLEFFSDVLGKESAVLVAQVVSVQDHLGDIQDAEVAAQRLAEFLAVAYRRQAAAETPFVVELSGVTEYYQQSRQTVRQLMETFGPVWQRVQSPKFRRQLAALIAQIP